MVGWNGKLYRSLCGSSNKDWTSVFFPSLNESPYFDGIEASLSDIGHNGKPEETLSLFFSLLQKHQKSWICGLYTSWNDYIGDWPEKLTVSDHLAQFEQQFKIISQLPVAPVYINCHSGSDCFTRSQALEFFNSAHLIHQRTCPQIPLGHETHRGRILYSPWVALDILDQGAPISFTLDLSHWIVVAERKIPHHLLKPIMDRTKHIHARVGTAQAPQIADPMNPADNPDYVKYFHDVWSDIAARDPGISITPEYGPVEDKYMPSIISAETGKLVISRDLEQIIRGSGELLRTALSS